MNRTPFNQNSDPLSIVDYHLQKTPPVTRVIWMGRAGDKRTKLNPESVQRLLEGNAQRGPLDSVERWECVEKIDLTRPMATVPANEESSPIALFPPAGTGDSFHTQLEEALAAEGPLSPEEKALATRLFYAGARVPLSEVAKKVTEVSIDLCEAQKTSKKVLEEIHPRRSQSSVITLPAS